VELLPITSKEEKRAGIAQAYLWIYEEESETKSGENPLKFSI
jgi:hypothetical protein